MKKILSIMVALVTLAATAFAQSVLDTDTIKKVTNAVFEVVVEKTEDTKIEYNDELPFDRLPFNVRNDKYMSIGTAFLLTDGYFYSASHVFALYGDTIQNKYFIRDSSGKTYPVDEIITLSNRRDFISFSVPTYKQQEGQGLSVSKKYEMNSNIFSVGNALGDGVIIRNGILTSETDEDRNGEWKWLRFSAAASPGNSGGPLINDKGEVIGIVTMKSQNENLNYALPIAEIDTGKDGIGVIDSVFYYRLPNILNKKQYHNFKYTIKLPMKYPELHKTLTQAYKKSIIDVVEIMSKDYSPTSPKSFDKSKGNAEMFYHSYTTDFPYVIYLNESNVWSYGGTNTKSFDLDDNGYIDYCSLLGYVLAKVVKPDSMSLEELLKNPKIYVDYVLEGNGIYRTVAGENVTIKSLGEPTKIEQHVDFFGRTWTASYFDINFADSVLICYALPMPDGVFMVYDTCSRSTAYCETCHDIEFALDFVYTSYNAKLKNWKEFRDLPESVTGKLPDFLKDITVEYDRKHLKFSIGDISTNLPPTVIKATDETKVSVTNSFTTKNGKLQIENRSLSIYTASNSPDYKAIFIKRINKPADSAVKKTKNNWNQFLNEVSPFDGAPYNYEQYTYQDFVYFPDPANKSDPDHVYALSFELKKDMFEEIKKMSEKVVKNTQFK